VSITRAVITDRWMENDYPLHEPFVDSISLKTTGLLVLFSNIVPNYSFDLRSRQ